MKICNKYNNLKIQFVKYKKKRMFPNKKIQSIKQA